MKIEARLMGEDASVSFNARERDSAFRTAARKLGLGAHVGIAPTKVGTSQWQCDVTRRGVVLRRMMVTIG